MSGSDGGQRVKDWRRESGEIDYVQVKKAIICDVNHDEHVILRIFPLILKMHFAAQCQSSLWSQISFRMCRLGFQSLYIMSAFGPYLWKSLHFWQMDAIIKAWNSLLLNPKKVKSVCSGMWWLASSYRGMRSRCVACLLLEWKGTPVRTCGYIMSCTLQEV